MKCRSHVGSSILRIRALGRRILQKTVPDREHRAGERISVSVAGLAQVWGRGKQPTFSASVFSILPG